MGEGGGSEWRSGEKEFFNIVKKKKGKIGWSKRFDGGKGFLNEW